MRRDPFFDAKFVKDENGEFYVRMGWDSYKWIGDQVADVPRTCNPDARGICGVMDCPQMTRPTSTTGPGSRMP
jgi:hypothetical protein